MTPRRTVNYFPKWLGTIASAAAAMVFLSPGMAIAQDEIAYRLRVNPNLQVPPLGEPGEFLPGGDAVPPELPADPDAQPDRIGKPDSRIELRLSERRVYLYEDDEIVASYPVAVGKPGWETPVGEFQVTNMALDPVWENPWTGELVPPGPNSPIGPAVIVFYEGNDWIAFHGTPNEELIGQAVSHGCVRMRNDDILAMYEQVNPGTPVVVAH
jgi:lipoprotein-anchoring transpeptidase ErfK/SrfK